MRDVLVGLVVATMAAVSANEAAATVTLTASRPDTLYTTDDQFDCGDLARRMDADLPYNVVRLRADDDTGQAASFRWKLPKPNVGFLMPDDPEIDSSAGGAFAVQGFCAQIGSGCVFTEETIKAYRRPTILWAAPTCADGLPRNTRVQFAGDTVRIRVKADGQRGKAAKATVDVGYGRLGTPILWVSTASGPDNGIGKGQIVTSLLPTFSVTLEPSIMPPVPIKDYVFDNGADAEVSATSCTLPGAVPGAVACGRLEYETGGSYFPFVQVRLEDDSAYCDNADCRVGRCTARPALVVERSPRRQTYRSRDMADLTVRWENRSPRNDGCGFVFDRLTCTTEVKKGKFEESESVTFVPPRCEADPLIPCTADVDCGLVGPCLSFSHCSETTDEPCAGDADCSRRECARCQQDETCIRVLTSPDGDLLPGQSVDLINETIELRSVFPGKTKVTETWEVFDRFENGNATNTYRFKIRGEPVQ